MRRVAITGIGVVSPLGNTPDDMFSALANGQSGIRRLTGEAYARLSTRIAACAEFDGSGLFDAPKLRMLDRVTQFALAAARQALQQSRLDLAATDPARAGVFIGTGMGGAQTTDDGYRTLYGEQSDRIKPYSVLLAMNNAAASWIGLEHGLRGPNLTYSTACSSSAVALGEAALRIRCGDVDIMLAGGTEALLWPGPIKAWEALRTLATEDATDPAASCKPFSRNRSGMVLGEGAAMLVLEEWEQAVARGATILAELRGYGLTTDIAHMTRPSVEGQARAMALALAAAGMSPADIGYVNAHGTGTLANDPVETAAIKQVFGEHACHVAVSSTKSMHGHLLGAAGALEFAIAVLAMQRGVIPPTANLAQPDPECDLDYVPNQARGGCSLSAVMSNSFAFGGTNAALVACAA
jgi:beta-ketoacyl-acyl-carrier-protein synthase II